ncbi:MAG: hypothetical protein QOF76_4596 [Solirubrobacteraceae bacterium]|jgi:hypothetical protein|nr:hypothetical protein [Solirubrobacteraceae bacterium]
MDRLELAVADALLLFDGAVVEVFRTGYTHPTRTPAAWIAVKVEPRKHDRVRLTLGRTEQTDRPLYGPDVALSWSDMVFELDATDEPQVRAFFATVAGARNRV